MRLMIGLALSTLLLTAVLPRTAAADDMQKFESRDFGISFEYPKKWKTTQSEPRGVLTNEIFSVRATDNPTTAFSLAVYRLDTLVTSDNVDEILRSLDEQVAVWVATLPSGDIIDSSDILLDDAEGRVYEYEYQLNGQMLEAEMILVPNGDKVVEITHWARATEYDDKLTLFDQIFVSLILPWTPAS